jgi:hypothetical protein
VPTDRKQFIVAFLAATVLLISVFGAFASAGATVAVPMSDTGGFTVAFDELKGNGFEQYSTMEGHEACAQYPVTEARIDNGTIEGLHLFKDLEMPVANDTVRVSIRGTNTEFEGLTQRFTHLEGDIAFDGEQVVEYDNDRDRMRVSARNITIENSTIRTESQYITYLSLNELDVGVETNPDDSGDDGPKIDCLADGGSDENSSVDTSSDTNGSDGDSATNISVAATNTSSVGNSAAST